MQTAFAFILLVGTICANLLLALFVITNNPKSVTNRIFCALSVVISIWLIVNYLSLDLHIIGGTLLWVRLTIFFATPMSYLFFLLAATLPKFTLPFKRRIYIIFGSLTLLVMLITISPYAFTDLKIVNNTSKPIPGLGIIPFTILSTFYSLSAVYFLLKKSRKSLGLEKNQSRYMLMGISLMLGLIILTILIPAVVFNKVLFVPFIPIYTLIFLGMTTYAIVRHRLMDIRILAARSIAYLLILTIIAVGYSIIIIIIGSNILNITFSPQQYFFFGVMILASSFAFHPLQRRLERITDRLFYKGFYDTQEILHTLSGIMASTIDLTQITNHILTTLLSNLRISRGAFVLLKSHDHGEIEFIENKGFDPEIHIEVKSMSLFLSQRNMILFDELEEGEVKQTMRDLNISVVLPLFAQEDKVGILCFGEKSSGDIYSEQDIRLLEILQPELSVAIQNSREFEEIKRFNITLKEEIDKATKDLQDANERLKYVDKLKDEFVSLASHELRTPMTSIKSYIWMLLDPQMSSSIGALNEKQKLYLDRVYKSTERLVNLVNDMLSVSRIESGRLMITQKPLNIVELAKAAVNDVLPTAQEHKLILTVKEPEHILPNVFADEEKIKQVLINLIGNSLKFTPEKGSITISFTEKGGQVAVSVQDTGKGIKPEDMGKLFVKFGMIEENYGVRPQTKGTGLGLYISKSIVELHGGHITVYSEGEDKGATFTFTLPVAE